jgi:hypothetical protein
MMGGFGALSGGGTFFNWEEELYKDLVRVYNLCGSNNKNFILQFSFFGVGSYSCNCTCKSLG